MRARGRILRRAGLAARGRDALRHAIRCALMIAAVWALCVGADEAGPPPTLLLIASPQMQDPGFAGAVVLVTQTPDGPFGFIVNRPLSLTVGEAFPGTAAPVALAPVYLGGPVARRALGVLFSAAAEPPGARRVMDGIYLSLDAATIDGILRAAEPPRRLRFFAGYSGWAPGQLERELARGDWQVWPADEATVFDTPAHEMWPLLHGRAGARRAAPAEAVRARLTAGLPPRAFGGGRGAAVEHLEEDFVVADHAELGARPLFDRVGALLEVADLGVERGVARAQPRVVVALDVQTPFQIAHREPAPLPHPQRVLQRDEQRGQHGGEQLHWRSW